MVTNSRARKSVTASVSYDEGLRLYFLNIYNYMAIGLGLTGVVAFFSSKIPGFAQAVATGPLQWVLLIGLIGYVFFISAKILTMEKKTALTHFFIYSSLMGLLYSTLMLVYTGESLARVFFITAAMFGGMSLFGYTTKKNLSGLGSFLIMGAWGIFIAFIVNIFLQSPVLHYVASFIGIIVFTGMIAYDTQKFKSMYYQLGGVPEMRDRVSVLAALNLYLDFVNLFVMLLQFLGQRRD
jgi:FtsH-binding integral membrane protein